MKMSGMISEYLHNRGAPEIECEAEIEYQPYKDAPFYSFTFEVLYEMDGGCRINGIYLKGDESEHDYTSDFTPEQYSQAELACIDDYNYRCDMAEAYAEGEG